MTRSSETPSKGPRVSGRIEGITALIKLASMSDEEQNTCLAAIQQQLDPTAKMEKGVITCTIAEPNRNSRRRTAAVHDLKRRAVSLARVTVDEMRSKAKSAASSEPTRPSPRATPKRREPQGTRTKLAFQR